MVASLRRIQVAVVLACVACYGMTLGTTDFFHDDRVIIAENPLLHHGWRGAPDLFTSGYWEALDGPGAHVQEYRPFLMLTFLAQIGLTGLRAPPMHAGNLLLHICVCLLLLEVFGRRLAPRAAAAAALIYAVMPVHTEAVSALTGRSELLSAALVLGSWLCLEKKPSSRRLAAGCLLFGAGLLTKEHAVLLPVLLALSDWTFEGKKPWERERIRVHAALGACAAVYLILRLALLSRIMHAGSSYFVGSSYLTILLTVSRFAVLRYLLPSLTGTGLCSDFTRPMIPDSGPASAASWLCLAGLAAFYGAAAWGIVRRRAWGFYAAGFSIFLLPTSHLILPIDTIGAERFLYLPTAGLAAGLGWLYEKLQSRSRAAAPLGAALLLWYAGAAAARNRVWRSQADYYGAAAACNPSSAGALAGLADAQLRRGESAAGRASLEAALALKPAAALPYYNMALLEWREGDKARSERLASSALQREPRLADGWILLGLAAEGRGELQQAQGHFEKAAELRPWLASAQFNLGRILMLRGKPREAWPHFARFCELAPEDPDAAQTRVLAARLKALSEAGR